MRSLFDVASDHSCCHPSTTVVTPLVLSSVVTDYDGGNLLFTIIVRCIGDVKVDQKAEQFLNSAIFLLQA